MQMGAKGLTPARQRSLANAAPDGGRGARAPSVPQRPVSAACTAAKAGIGCVLLALIWAAVAATFPHWPTGHS